MPIGSSKLFGNGADSTAVERAHAHAVEQILASARLVLAIISLGAFWLEVVPGQAPVLVVGLFAQTVYSVLLVVILRTRLPGSHVHPLYLHSLDAAWAILLTLPNGLLSPAYASFVFVILAAAYRWGLGETLATGAVFLAVPLAELAITGAPDVRHQEVVLRIGFLILCSLMVGNLAEGQRRNRDRAWAVAHLLSRVRAEVGLVSSLHAVLDELLRELQALHAVLVVKEDETGGVYVWQADARDGTKRSRIRLLDQSAEDRTRYLVDVDSRVWSWSVRRTGSSAGPRLVVSAYDASGARVPAAPNLLALEGAPFSWKTAVGLSSVSGDGWTAQIIVVDPRHSWFDEHPLRFLQAAVPQVAPAIFNLYLRRRLESRAGAVDRSRIARGLHDGVIQSLIGVQMQLDVLRRGAIHEIPPACAAELQQIQRVLGQEVLNIRDLMQALKPVDVTTDRLVEYLATLVERFRQRTGIESRLVSDADELDLTPRVCRELAATVQEALANVRKHSGASSVLIRLAAADGHVELTIDDNGGGFPFEGRLEHSELDARGLGPIVVKERLRSIGGRLVVHSHPGSGSRLEITVPRRHHG